MPCHRIDLFFFFFNDTATTEIYTLSLHDALPIFLARGGGSSATIRVRAMGPLRPAPRSEEHTSELQSPDHLVCRLLLEKKNILSAAAFMNSAPIVEVKVIRPDLHGVRWKPTGSGN